MRFTTVRWAHGSSVLEAHLLECVRDVGPSEGEVLESLGHAVLSSRVTNGGAHVRGDLGLSVHRHGAGLAVAHDSALKDIPSVLALVKEDAIGSLLH
jgi:hypothetical protein